MRAIMPFVAAAFILTSAVSYAQSAKTYTGVITDTMCGADHAVMNVKPDSKCVLECVRSSSSSKLALLQGKNLYLLSDQETPAKFAGQKVKVTGVLYTKTNVLKVDRIEPAQ